jgi:hypothetical protein
MKSRRRREWHLTVWILFLLAFVGAGALPFDTLGSQRRVRDQGPTNSSDAAYAADLSLENGSQRISECLQKLPANSRVAILFRLGTSQTVSSQMISLAAWMREFTPIPIASDAKNARHLFEESGCNAAFYLDGEPPAWLAVNERLSPLVSFARKQPERP